MPVTVTELQAVLSLRDEATAKFTAAWNQMAATAAKSGQSMSDISSKLSKALDDLTGNTTKSHEAFQTHSESINKFGEAARLAGEDAKQLGEGLRKLYEDPLAGLQQLGQVLKGEVSTGLSALGPEAALAGGAILGLGGAVTGAAATIFGLADHAAHAGEEVLAFSGRTGIAVENVGALKFAVEAAGGSLDQVSSIFQRIAVRQSTATGSSVMFNAALADLRINADEFNKMDNESKLLAIAAGFQKGTKSGNDMATAVHLLGRAGGQELPFLKTLTADLIAAGEKLGVQWTKDSIEAAERFNVGLRSVQGAIEGIATRIGLALLPALSDMISNFAKSPDFMNDVIQTSVAMINVLGYVVKGLGYITGGLMDMGAEFVHSKMRITEAELAFAIFVRAILEDMAKIPGIGNMFGTAISEMTDKAKGYASQLVDQTKQYAALKDGGTKVVQMTDQLGDSLIKVTAKTAQQVETQLRLNKATGDGGAAAAAFEKAVQGMVDAMEGDSKKSLEMSEAINRVIADIKNMSKAGVDDVEVKTRVVQAIEKMRTAGQQLSAEQQQFFEENITLSAVWAAGQKELMALDQKYAQVVAKDANDSLAAKIDANQKEYDDTKKMLDHSTMLMVDYLAAVALAKKIHAAEDDAARNAQLQQDNKFASETAKIWSESYATIAQADKDNIGAQIDNVQTWYDSQVDALNNTTNISVPQYISRRLALDADMTAKLLKITTDYWKQQDALRQADLDLQYQYDQLIMARNGQTVDAQLQANARWYSDQVQKAHDAGQQNQQYYDDLLRLAQAKAQDIIHAQDPIWIEWKKGLTDTRAATATAWEGVLSGTVSLTTAMLTPFLDLWTGIKKILAGILADFEQQLFNPLLKMAHNAMASLLNILMGSGSPAGGGIGGGILGGLLGGAAGGIGQNVTSLGTSLPGAAAGGLGGLFGGAGGAGLFGMGSLATGGILAGVAIAAPMVISGVKKVWDSLFGDAGRQAVVSWANSTYGSFDGLQKKLKDSSVALKQTGSDANQLWVLLTQGTGRNNAAQAQANINTVTAALKAADAAAAKDNTDIGNLLTQIQSFGGGIDSAMQPYIDALTKSGLLTQQNIDLIASMENNGAPTYQQMDALAKKYNLTMSQMGPTFQKQQMDSQFQTLIDDLDELQRGGADMNAVLINIGTDGKASLSDLGKQIQLMVTQSMQYGIALPANMKPFIDSLIKQGLLLDANGQAIKDDSKLTFGDTMQTSLDKLNDTLKQLIETLTGKGPGSVKGALEDVGNTVVSPHIKPILDGPNYPPGWGPDGGNPGAYSGGFATSYGLQHFARGGRVGTDTVPAMLTPGELILNAAQQSNLAATITTLATATNRILSIQSSGFPGRGRPLMASFAGTAGLQPATPFGPTSLIPGPNLDGGGGFLPVSIQIDGNQIAQALVRVLKRQGIVN